MVEDTNPSIFRSDLICAQNCELEDGDVGVIDQLLTCWGMKGQLAGPVTATTAII